jgi:hypothetical protein
MAGLRFIPPLLPTLAEEAPQGDRWLHEIKFDRYRTQIVVEAGTARAFTRNAIRDLRQRPMEERGEMLALLIGPNNPRAPASFQ